MIKELTGRRIEEEGGGGFMEDVLAPVSRRMRPQPIRADPLTTPSSTNQSASTTISLTTHSESREYPHAEHFCSFPTIVIGCLDTW